jgi:hypothetical protein
MGELWPDKYFISESVMQLQYLMFSVSSFVKPVKESYITAPDISSYSELSATEPAVNN